MGSGMEGPSEPVPRVHAMDEAEMKSFLQIQALLALTAYVAENRLGINPVSYLRQPGKQASDMRGAAMNAWNNPHPPNAPPLAEVFRTYWQSHRAEIEAADLSSAGVCLALVEKIRGSAGPNTQTTPEM